MPRRRETADERLRTYRAKRDFSVTAEPRGTDPPEADGWRYVVQRHRASSLHYDVRLEAGGVLVSWAVPKGPTLDPTARRLAVHVEDHPLDYYDFEGVIAAGEYGGGDVIVWDWGTWGLAEGDDPLDEIAAGDLHLTLDGAKLRGRFVLVRRGHDGREQWLLIKKRDDDAIAGWNPEDHPRSVKSGRTNDEVRDAPAASWSGRGNWAGPTDDELVALDELGTAGTWSLGGHDVRLIDLDTAVAPGDGTVPPVTRRELVRYQAVMAPAILPYVADRPLDVPRGALPSRLPAWLRSWRDETGGRAARQVVADSAAALAWLAGRGVVELRPQTSTVDDPRHPSWVCFCIHAPPGGDVADVLALARLHRAALDHLGVEARPVVDGAGGVQILVPVGGGATAADTRRFAGTVTGAVVATLPDLGAAVDAPDSRAVAERFLAPFSARPTAGAPVAVPLGWAELDDEMVPRWTIDDVAARLRRRGDPLAALIGSGQRLPRLEESPPPSGRATPGR